MLIFYVPGRPAAQGSKRHVGNGRFIEASKYLPAWRKTVTEHAAAIALASDWRKADGPVQLHLDFYLGRPQSVTRAARPFAVKPPDLDKLIRAVCDSLTDAGIWVDDSQVIRLIAGKDYDDVVQAGVSIQVVHLDKSPADNRFETLNY